MRVFAQALDLVDDPARIDQYVRHHRAVWPEVTGGLRAIGVQGMRIWRGGTRLFMVIETDDDFDPARYQTYAAEPRAREWDALMRDFQRPAPFAKPGEWWTPLEEVFDLSRSVGSSECGVADHESDHEADHEPGREPGHGGRVP